MASSSSAASAAKVINFYSTSEVPYGAFSNFAAFPFSLKGRRWPTSEHYFQAMKFEASAKDFEEIRALESPMDAAKAGRERTRPLRPDWEAIKDQVMFDAVRAKFTENPTIRKVLLDTGDATIVEHTKNDSYWGDGGDGSGKNMLGITLMRVRELLREEEAAKAADPTTIKFFRDDGEFGCFANFAPFPITVLGLDFPTTEHYFQAMKFSLSPKDFEQVRALPTPKEAAKAGRDRARPLRPDWEEFKMAVMENALQCKFLQHGELRAKLLATGDKTLVEHSDLDNFWGDGGDGSGRNELGKMLMKIRGELRSGELTVEKCLALSKALMPAQ